MRKTKFIESYKAKVLSIRPKLNNLKVYIKNSAIKYDLDPEILYGILLLETCNRGGFLYRGFEKMLLKLTPNYFVKKDPSLGIGQIKISTASNLLGKDDYVEISKLLTNKKDNINICAKLLKKHLNQINSDLMYNNNWFLSISKLYLTGKIDAPNYPWIEMYSELLQWSFYKKLFYNAKKSHWKIP